MIVEEERRGTRDRLIIQIEGHISRLLPSIYFDAIPMDSLRVILFDAQKEGISLIAVKQAISMMEKAAFICITDVMTLLFRFTTILLAFNSGSA